MRLLEPLELGTARAPNRLLFGPHVTNLGWNRALSERHLAYYERRLRGGAGIVVVEEASVHPSDWPYERSPLASACGPGWAAIAEVAHRHGALALAGLGHAGGQGSSAHHQDPLWAPSAIPEVNTREVPKVMEAADIAAVVAGFGEAAARAAASGLDGVEVNAGQHSLVRQFLSALTNQRSDDYGVDKVRFALEVLAAVRAGLGTRRVLGLRLSCDELAPWAGITPEAAAELAIGFAPLVDYLVVTRGAIFSVAATRPDMHEPAGVNLEPCGRIRSAVAGAVAIFAQGSIVDPAQAEAALAEGRADGVEMTRAQIADPDLGARLAAGRPERVRSCLLCNQRCQVRDNRNPLVSCVVEPRSGYEWDDPDPDPPRVAPAAGVGGAVAAPGLVGRAEPTVLVVGGGPAGLECARVGAGHGRTVVVAERGELGGWARRAARARGRERLELAAAWLESECRHLGVRLDVGRAVTPEEAAGHDGPVVVCSGGVDRPRPELGYEVSEEALVLSAAELLTALSGGGTPPPEGPVAVWDPVGGPIGVSVAEELAARGRETLLVTPDPVVGTLLALSGDLPAANVRLHQAGIRLVKRARLRRVEADRLLVEDRFGAGRSYLAAAALVDAGHRLPDPTPWPERARRAGDAVAPRTIYDAVLEGRRAGLAVVGRAPGGPGAPTGRGLEPAGRPRVGAAR